MHQCNLDDKNKQNAVKIKLDFLCKGRIFFLQVFFWIFYFFCSCTKWYTKWVYLTESQWMNELMIISRSASELLFVRIKRIKFFERPPTHTNHSRVFLHGWTQNDKAIVSTIVPCCLTCLLIRRTNESRAKKQQQQTQFKGWKHKFKCSLLMFPT